MPDRDTGPGLSVKEADSPVFALNLPIKKLTEREQAVLYLAAQGQTAMASSRRLFLSERMVKVHLATARKKLQAKTTTQAVAVAFCLNLLEFNAPPVLLSQPGAISSAVPT